MKKVQGKRKRLISVVLAVLIFLVAKPDLFGSIKVQAATKYLDGLTQIVEYEEKIYGNPGKSDSYDRPTAAQIIQNLITHSVLK